jgi:riboflavin synthase
MAPGVFTGLVQTQGQLQGRTARGAGYRLTIRHDLGALELGESIAVNGACLTVAAFSSERFEADCSMETAKRTTLGRLPIGGSLHLERALRVGDRLGGHFVSGHVDTTVKLIDAHQVGEAHELSFELPSTFAPYVAEKGSVTLDGVSLTVTGLSPVSFKVMVVPHTLSSTRLGSLRRGDDANFEVDVLARYVVHLARFGQGETTTSTDTNQNEVAPTRDEVLKKALARAGLL